MSNYTLTTAFLAKDSLISGNPLKLVKGADFQTEFTNVQTAVATKVDGAGVYFPDGNAAQPSVGFTNNAGTGMFNTAGALGVATGNTQRLSISANGNVVVATPASGTALAVNGLANNNALSIFGSATSGQSFGASIGAGTTSADYAFNVSNQASTIQMFRCRGDGVVLAVDDGGAFQTVGWRDIPVNAQGGNYTCVLADRGKFILSSGAGSTITIPANASVAYPVGTVLTFINVNAASCSIAITTDTLQIAGTSTTGTRTLANAGVATAIKWTSTGWFISGSGLT